MSTRLRLHISAAAETAVRSGHPWLFAESVREQNRDGDLGELAILYDRRDRFLGIGLFDPDSPLRVRVLHTGKPIQIDLSWWRRRLRQALDRRAELFDQNTTGFRWVNGESDGWPGFVLDRYDRTLVIKLYTAAWLAHLPLWTSLLQTELEPLRLVLRLSRNIQDLASRQFRCSDGQVLCGPPLEGSVIFQESGLRFEVDVVRGQKTGFFLDQRENRRRVESLSRGREVLNVFSFAGGFSLYAARGGARSATDLDISAHALAAARRNFALNATAPGIAACRYSAVQADAFEWLESARSTYDLIVLDPPSLAKKEVERAGALQAYRRLVRAAIRLLRPAGVLVAASCSAHVDAAEFFSVVRETSRAVGGWIELATTLHPPDHPATFPEALYLKAIYLQRAH